MNFKVDKIYYRLKKNISVSFVIAGNVVNRNDVIYHVTINGKQFITASPIFNFNTTHLNPSNNQIKNLDTKSQRGEFDRGSYSNSAKNTNQGYDSDGLMFGESEKIKIQVYAENEGNLCKQLTFVLFCDCCKKVDFFISLASCIPHVL